MVVGEKQWFWRNLVVGDRKQGFSVEFEFRVRILFFISSYSNKVKRILVGYQNKYLKLDNRGILFFVVEVLIIIFDKVQLLDLLLFGF